VAQPQRRQVGYLERMPLRTPYPKIVTHVHRLVDKPCWGGKMALAIDQTGVGAPVADMFAARGIPFAGVQITAGTIETCEDWARQSWRVAKQILISRLDALVNDGRLKFKKSIPEAAQLVRELQDYQYEITESGNMTFNAPSGSHDDLLLAAALAIWRATKLIPEPPLVMPFVFKRRRDFPGGNTGTVALESGDVVDWASLPESWLPKGDPGVQ
jgi:hypothetical protein